MIEDNPVWLNSIIYPEPFAPPKKPNSRVPDKAEKSIEQMREQLRAMQSKLN